MASSILDSGLNSGLVSKTKIDAAPSICAHCDLTVPAGLVVAGDEHQFCCCGCRTAWTLIHDNGLEAWYRIAIDRQRPAIQSDDDSGNVGFDVPGFLERYATDLGDGCFEITLTIEGIHCAACVWLIERIEKICPGVERAAVNWSRRTVTLVWQNETSRLSKIADALGGLGYRATPITPDHGDAAGIRENRQLLMRMGIAGAAAGNNMLIATALYLGLFSTMEAGHLWLLRMASCAVGLVSLLWPGRVFFQGAIAAIRTRTPHMDLPVALGLGVGGIAGLTNTLLGRGEIYFDSLSVLVFLLLVGRYVQYRQQRRAADAIDLLYRMTPSIAWKIEGDSVVQVQAEMLQPGDRIRVRAGETMPADGVVVEGESSLDESILTGEPEPVVRLANDFVSAGTMNVRSPIVVAVTAAGEATRLGNILRMVQAAALDRPQIVQWADRAGGWFVAVVIVLAIATLLGWWIAGSDRAVDHAVALLIVACPCALALATPLTLSVAIGRAASRGIMIKGGDVLSRLSRPGRIWLDKTGTLTAGKMRVVRWEGDERLKSVVATIQSHSRHPLADAFAMETGPVPVLEEASDVRQVMGLGIEGTVAGRRYQIGSEKFLASTGVVIDRRWLDVSKEIVDEGLSPVFVSEDNRIRALVGVGDPVRTEAASLVKRLLDGGWRVGILSGDHPATVQNVARRLGIDSEMALGRLSPEDKVQKIQSGERDLPTVMVGDGVNDSPALAAADVGIAVHSGAHASLQAAPVWLARSGIGEIADLLDASQDVRRTIQIAVFASLFYNIVAVVLAAAGWIHPLAAAALMPLSSLTVVAVAIAGKSFASSRL